MLGPSGKLNKIFEINGYGTPTIVNIKFHYTLCGNEEICKKNVPSLSWRTEKKKLTKSPPKDVQASVLISNKNGNNPR